MAPMQLSGTVPAFGLRISITDTEPLIWRTLQVPVALTVPEFHLAVQAAFGWENSHLYAIRWVDRAGKPREIAGPHDLTEDLDAEPASGVVLSELLDAQKPGTTLEHEYDFGDSWTHHVEVLGSADLPVGELLCVDGANRGPVEDSGGPHGHKRLLQIVADPVHPEHAKARYWISGVTGEYGKYFAPATFDRQAANRKLRLLSLQWWPQPLSDEERDAVLLPVRWLLENAAPDGLELTKDGYLKPTVVKRALDELGWSDPIMGKGNRETHARPVLELRLHLIDWKLLRKFKGRLVLTPRGKRCLERPAELWDYLVEAVARSGHPIPDEWVSDINRVVHRNFKCLHLMAPKVGHLGRALLTDGGVKFLLAVQAVGRSG
ncbi:plasmid pRiA4b ORF-3 family protein [Pseudarthrobacter sp. Y6]|uniref:plasmid pRiA4b ORF-3 family protein n=1 Tax=Pseudarthrobacter sp. Y6 TaxID=3418422 RepID=UPI003CF3399B